MTKKEEYRMYIHTHQSNVIKAADLYGSQICNYLNIDKRLLTHQRARIHDMSKFSENEFDGYRQYFYPNDGETKNKELFDKNYPAQFIAEGLDQTRGWFYSLINLGVGLFGKAPYEHVIVNGLVLASSGVKLSMIINSVC